MRSEPVEKIFYSDFEVEGLPSTSIPHESNGPLLISLLLIQFRGEEESKIKRKRKVMRRMRAAELIRIKQCPVLSVTRRQFTVWISSVRLMTTFSPTVRHLSSRLLWYPLVSLVVH